MSTAAAPAPAATEAAAAPAVVLPDAAGSAAARFIEAKEATAPKPEGKKPADAKAAETPKPEGKPAPRIDPNVVRREREAREAKERADALVAKYGGLEEALGKRDFVKAMTLLAEKHGATFADFVTAFEAAGEIEPKDPVEAARAAAREESERIERERREREAREAQARATEEQKALDERIGKLRETLQGMAEGDPERWELTAVSGRGGEAWDLIAAHHEATGEKLSMDQALDLIEGKLKQKRDEARAKGKGSRPGAGDNGRNEAAATREGGRAAEPPVNNRTAGGAPAVLPRSDGPVDFGSSAIKEAARRAGIKL